MISVSEATHIIQSHLFKAKKEKVELSKTVGRILAEPITADRDLPPFHRAAMDGIAILFESFQKGQREFKIERVLAAGEPAASLSDPTHTIEIMTGAALPGKADTIIRYEDVEIADGKAKIRIDTIEKGQFIHSKGQDAKANEVLLSPGIKISPAEVALLASVGKSKVEVFQFPKIAIISTGNELVDVAQTPKPHQIRKSNSYALQAALLIMNCEASLFHLPDEKNVLEKELKSIFKEHEVIILSGGVSKGKFDFIPEVLTSLGIEKKFHQVNQRPGKPFWFGYSDQHTVFALPGNPVSTYMCFYKYIKPWLLKSLGVESKMLHAKLGENFSFKPALTYFLQVRTENESGQWIAYPDPGGGSGDFANLKNIDGFLELPADRTEFKKNEVFPYIPFRS